MKASAFLVPGNLTGAAPGCTHIGKEHALYLLGNGEPIFNRSRIHLVAAEFIIFITAKRIGTAQGKEVIVRHVACSDTAHESNGNDVFYADFIIQSVFDNKLVVIEVTAQTMTGPSACKGQAFAVHGIVNIVTVIENMGPRYAVRRTEVVVNIVTEYGQGSRIMSPGIVVVGTAFMA